MKGARHRRRFLCASSPLNKEEMSYIRVTNMETRERERAISSRLVKQRNGRRSIEFGKILTYVTYFRNINPAHVASAQR